MKYYHNYLKQQKKLFTDIVIKLEALLNYCIINNKFNCSRTINFKLEVPLDDLTISVFQSACQHVMDSEDFKKYKLLCCTVETVNVEYGSFAKLTIRIQKKEND